MSIFYDGKGNSITISNEDGNNSNTDFLTGKKWLVIGDSITNNAAYRPMITEKYGLTELKGAYQGGMRVCYSAGNDYCVLEKLDNIDEGQPDIITIALGTNDDNNNNVGAIGDDPTTQTIDNYTFYGCYKALITRLFAKYGYVPMLLITPYPRQTDKSNIVNAIEEIGRYYSIPVLNLQEESGLTNGRLTDTSNDNLLFTDDMLHINPYGGSITAPKIADKMNLIIQKWDFPHTNLLRGHSASITLTNTKSQAVSAYVIPNYSTDFNKIVWECSDESVATIKVRGNFVIAEVTAVANGTCTITAKLGNFTVTYNITVALE